VAAHWPGLIECSATSTCGDAVPAQGSTMISVLIGVLIICVVGAICFWAIEKFIREARLANLLKLLVVLICLAAILQRVLPFAGINL
jgi:NhaP-type Na+/H+ or K+/H+ antiporter